MANASDVYQLFLKHFDEHDFRYEKNDADLVIKLTVQGEDLPQPTVIRVIEKANAVLIQSPMPFSVPEDKRTDMAVAITIVNYSMINGGFEMDLSNGMLSYKIAQGLFDEDFSEKTVEYMLTLTFGSTDRFNDKFFGLAMGMMTLEQFIEKIQAA